MRWFLLVFLASSAHATDPAFYPRGTATNQAMGGINQNFLDQSTQKRNRLTTAISPASCPAGQALTGAFYNNGYSFGGACAAFTLVGQATVTTASPISGIGTPPNPIALTGAIPQNLVNLSTVTQALANYFLLSNILPMTSGGTGLSASGTTGNVLTSTGTGWVSYPPAVNGIGSLPVGTIIPFLGTTAPGGTLECNGTSYLDATYPILYATIGCAEGCADGTHFNVPDLRGVFLRGWNHGSSSSTYTGDYDAGSRSTFSVNGASNGNSGDTVGSYENDVFKSHTHQYQITTGGGTDFQAGSNANLGQANTSATGGNETRPKNFFVMFAIKYDDNAQLSSGISLSGSSGTILSQSSITASAFFGDGSHLTGLTDFGPSTATLSASTVTLAGLVFTLGQSTAALSASTTSIAANYLPLTGGAISGTLAVVSTLTVGGYSGIPHMDTYARLKAATVSGTAWMAWATDIKEFVFFTGNTALGDKGWFIQ